MTSEREEQFHDFNLIERKLSFKEAGFGLSLEQYKRLEEIDFRLKKFEAEYGMVPLMKSNRSGPINYRKLIEEKKDLLNLEEKIKEQKIQELVEKFGGIFLGTEQIQEAFSLYDKEGKKIESLISKDLLKLELPTEKEIEKIAGVLEELNYTKWALIREVAEDKNGQGIDINWLNKYFQKDPKDSKIKLIYQGNRMASKDPADLKMKTERLENQWSIIVLDSPSYNSRTVDKSDQEQKDLIKKINQTRGFNLFIPKAVQDLYAVLGVYLATNQKVRQDPSVYFRTASPSANENLVAIYNFDEKEGINISQVSRKKSPFINCAIGCRI